MNCFTTKLVDIIIHNPDDNFIICGDFNPPGISWVPDPFNTYFKPLNYVDIQSSTFVDTVSFSGLFQFNCNRNCAGNVLDLVFSNTFSIFELHLSDLCN